MNEFATQTDQDKGKWKAVYTIIERGGDKRSLWLRIGTAWLNRDASLNVKLDAIPTNGQIHIRDYEPPAERVARQSAAQTFNAGDSVVKRLAKQVVKGIVGAALGVWLIGAAHAQSSPRAPREVTEPAATTEGVVNLNEATAEEIERLPAIGPTKAKAIVDYRKTHPFRRVEELNKVKGIGRKTLVKLRPYVTLKGPTTLASEPKAASASKK